VLTAGLGTRLQPLSFVRAKAAVPIAGQPLIARILRWLESCEIRQVVLNLHHLPETITARVGDGSEFGVRVRYSWEFPVLGSAGGPRKALPLLPNADFFIINGDTLTDVDLNALAHHHRDSGALVTMALVRNQWPGRYGGVVTDAAGVVHGFVPRTSAAASYHFIGVQVVHPSVFADVPPDRPVDTIGIGGALYRDLIAKKPGSIRGFLCGHAFIDVGTAAGYLEAALTVSKAEGLPAPPIGERSRVAKTARLTETVIWDDVEVGAGAELSRCVVADGVKIPEGAMFEHCAIVQQHGALVVTDISHG
jgi:mannose-1-phosphate guanylyltransferase